MSPCVSSGTQPEVHLIKSKLLESIGQIISFGCLVLKGRAQKDVFETAMFEEKCFKR